MADSTSDVELKIHTDHEEHPSDAKQKESEPSIHVATSTEEAASEKVEDDSDKWEWVMVFEDVKPPEPSHGKDGQATREYKSWTKINTERLALVEELKNLAKAAGLIIARRKSFDDSKYFLLISATEERLEWQAEKLEMTLPVLSGFGEGYREFTIKKKSQFQRANEKSFFRSAQRVELIRTILEDKLEEGGLFLQIGKKINDKIITKFFALHDNEARKELLQEWANPKAFFKWQPINKIRDYFGEYIALYFAYLGTYTESCAIAAILGVIVMVIWIIGVAINAGNMPVFAAWALTAYSIILAVWATVFIERWKREQAKWSYTWGMQDFEEREQERPEFIGQMREGVYYKGEWIEWSDLFPKNPVQVVDEEALTDKSNAFAALQKIKAPQERYYQYTFRMGKITAGVPLLVTMTVAVIIATVGLLSFRLFVQKKASAISIVGSIVNAVSIIILNAVWRKVAYVLTNWENHRTQTRYEDHLIFKIFIFEFINSYISLYYMAFFKNGTFLWNSVELQDLCSYGTVDPILSVTIGNACVYDLSVQLITIMIINITVGQIQELLVPVLISYGKYWWNTRKNPNWKHMTTAVPRYELEANFSEYAGTIDDYVEMIIQYGYLTIFAVAFPLAPLFALLNNMIEIRTDGIKLLRGTNRPPYRGAQDIGTWQTILEVISIVAVITNCLLVGFSFAAISESVAGAEKVAIVLAIIIGMEHGLFAIKYAVAWVIPDVPGYIRKKLAQNEFLDNEAKRLVNTQAEEAKGFSHETKVTEQKWKFSKTKE